MSAPVLPEEWADGQHGYRARLLALAYAAERAGVAIWRAYVGGHLGRRQTVALLAAGIARANSRAGALAAVAHSARLTAIVGRPVAVPVIAVPDDAVRLAKAATTVLDTASASDVPEAIVGRLARAEPLESAAQTTSAAISASNAVSGWIRQTNPDACQLCVWWAAGGKVYPAERKMPTHPGCSCQQIPVIGK